MTVVVLIMVLQAKFHHFTAKGKNKQNLYIYIWFQEQLKSAAIVLNGGVITFFGISLYRGDEKFYETIAMPMLRMLGPETAHNFTITAAKYKLVPRPRMADPATLVTDMRIPLTRIDLVFILMISMITCIYKCDMLTGPNLGSRSLGFCLYYKNELIV